MKCNKVRKALSRFADHEVTEPQKTMIERHLAECASCRAGLAALRADAGLLRSVSSPEAPPYLVPRAMAEIRGLGHNPKSQEDFGYVPRRGFWARAIPVAAAVVLAVAGAWCGTLLGREFSGTTTRYAESVLAVNSEPSLDDVYQTVVVEER